MLKSNEPTTDTDEQAGSDLSDNPNYEAATAIVMTMHQDMNGTLGVLLTLAEVAMAGSPALKSYKDQIRREFQLVRGRTHDSIYYHLKLQEQLYSAGAVYFSGESNTIQ